MRYVASSRIIIAHVPSGFMLAELIGRPSAWGPVWAVLLTTDAKTEGKEKADGDRGGRPMRC
jgi:hypothetical protein